MKIRFDGRSWLMRAACLTGLATLPVWWGLLCLDGDRRRGFWETGATLVIELVAGIVTGEE